MYDLEKKAIWKQFGAVLFEKCWIAGGAVTSVFTNAPINDFDLYFSSREAFEAALELAYQKGFWCVSLTQRAITFKKADVLYQFMHFRFFDAAQQIFESFDFTCCMGALRIDADAFILHDRFLPDASRRELIFNHNTAFPLASGMRIFKYMERGYKIRRKEWLKVALAIMFKQVDSWDGLKDQIGGTYGDAVSMDTSKPFHLDSVIESLNGAHMESKSEKDPPISADEAIDPHTDHLPSTAKEAIAMIAK